mmetsp:Transcript_84140/g.167932  ORF Transcript_84140/g.167932 Transcript_84140/m.167932 type:complete len:179 (-) Transcript_84140:628-1164(-)|eukprot:CAMPEP_0174727286 /NCGR_PEP_ID=MMETSP1094-20130205/49463_1 /TAXON_ID=156173 /ORGANISM="Chrysochromulina brevifilum, Strain UTEX LB 985" /LENGTH=178 /DNA_ID=CAMNT_0015928991 /DNA_START=54 /DNA_END=590 /DNA_ORIENTATION=-
MIPQMTGQAHLDPVMGAVDASVEKWLTLRRALMTAGDFPADGEAANHSAAAREEAALKLVANHEAVMRDVTNAAPKTQENLERVGIMDAGYVDEMLRETCRRLLGRRPGTEQLKVEVNPLQMGQQKAWARTAKYLDKRIQAVRLSTLEIGGCVAKPSHVPNGCPAAPSHAADDSFMAD